MQRFLGIDLGSVRTGLALSDEIGFMAHPFQTLKTSSQTPQVIAELVEEKKITAVIIGLPRNMNGTYGPAAEHCKKFAAQLEPLTKAKIILWDERLTTVAATRQLHERGLNTKQQRSIIDQAAAQKILQDWMDSQELCSL